MDCLARATGKKFPTALTWTNPKAQPFIWDEEKEFTYENVKQWQEAVLHGTAETFKKSAPIPVDEQGSVRTLVYKNHDEVVKDGKFDVFVDYYAPWCGHCQQLAPVWEQLGLHFKGDTGVVIAKYDTAANFISELMGVNGIPTLRFYPAGNAEAILYPTERSLQNLINFVETNRKTEAPAKENEDARDDGKDESGDDDDDNDDDNDNDAPPQFKQEL